MLLKSWIPKNHYPCDVETDRKGGGTSMKSKGQQKYQQRTVKDTIE